MPRLEMRVPQEGPVSDPSGFRNVAPPMGVEKVCKLAAPSLNTHLSRERAKLKGGDTHAADQDPAAP